MRRYVVSAPRSGFNWLKFWVGYFGGPSAGHEPALVRSHDPLGLKPRRFWRRRDTPAWRAIDPEETAGGRVLLILRDPLEVYVRAARCSLRRFGPYESCIRFSHAAAGAKMVVHYDDLVARPEAVLAALRHLDLASEAAADLEAIRAKWDSAVIESRASYNARHSHGTKTATAPLDFLFHQRGLSRRARAAVWRHLEGALGPEELALLDRYRAGLPGETVAPPPFAGAADLQLGGADPT